MAKAVAFIGRPTHLEMRVAADADFPHVLQEIRDKWKEGGRFFEGSSCVRIVGTFLENERKELSSLLINEFGISEVEFIGGIRKTRRAFDMKKPSSLSFDFLNERIDEPIDDTQPEPLKLHSGVVRVRESNALFVLDTVRNGQRVAYDGDIVVMGDANVGSELVATGSIVVMGALRGMAHAGSAGDETANVSAFRLTPQQLRIGAQMAIAPDDAKEMSFSEVAVVSRGEIVIKPVGMSRRKFWSK